MGGKGVSRFELAQSFLSPLEEASPLLLTNDEDLLHSFPSASGLPHTFPRPGREGALGSVLFKLRNGLHVSPGTYQ